MTDAIRKRRENRAGFDAALASWKASSGTVKHEEGEHACGACRHWGGEPDSAVLGSCRVSGSFRAPGGLFTEGDFCCCHWTKS